jgi:hypothetical protein
MVGGVPCCLQLALMLAYINELPTRVGLERQEAAARGRSVHALPVDCPLKCSQQAGKPQP